MNPPKPRELRELLRRGRMTVCIAAICQQDKTNRQERIVLCCDWNSETQFGGSETADKLRTLPKGWVALMADSMSHCEELVAQYERHLRGLGEVLDDRQLFEEMKVPAHNQKEVLANDYLKQTLGISYADLVSPDKRIPDEVVTKKLDEVSQIRLRAGLILAGFVNTQQGEQGDTKENHPYLFVVEDGIDHENVVRVEENFAAIGSGAYVAIPALHQREHDDNKSLMETVYSVYEAKRLAEVVPGVGKDTSLHVMYPDGHLMTWTDALYHRCEWLFGKLGPKLQISDKKSSEYFEFRGNFLESFDEETGDLKT